MKQNSKLLLFRIIYEFVFVLLCIKSHNYINHLSTEILTSALQKLYYGNIVFFCIVICHVANLIIFIVAFASKRNRNLEKYSQFQIGKNKKAKKIQEALIGITAVTVFIIYSFGLIYPAVQEALPEVKRSYTEFVPSVFFGINSPQDEEIEVEETFVFATASAAWFVYEPEESDVQDDFCFNIYYAYNCYPPFLNRIMEEDVQRIGKSNFYNNANITNGEENGIKYIFVQVSDISCYEVFALYEKQYLHAYMYLPDDQSDIVPYENYVLDRCLQFMQQ